jgi:hypothetical protein
MMMKQFHERKKKLLFLILYPARLCTSHVRNVNISSSHEPDVSQCLGGIAAAAAAAAGEEKKLRMLYIFI